MTPEPVLVLAWLILAHLVGDFVFQNERLVAAKADDGARGLTGLVVHSALVGLCLVPVGFAFGAAGWTVVAVVTISHGLVDRAKILMTRRAEAEAIAAAADRPGAGGAILGPAWTPIPGALFILDQLVHLAILGWAWAVWLSGASLAAGFVEVVDGALGAWDREVVHAVTLAGVVGLALVIANVRGGLFFVATLVHPREMVEGTALPEDHVTKVAPLAGWRVRIGPLEARVDAAPAGTAGAEAAGRRATTAPDGPAAPAAADHPPPPARPARPPARVGATIGVIERLLIVVLILTGAAAAVGLVVAAKTIARFRQLDDRDFAEYYLLGTLASVGTAIVTALLAGAALATLG